jgi:paraquat-inducible protein B
MEDEYVDEATAIDDLDKIEDEIMRSFEQLYEEPHRPAIAQVAAVVEKLFEQTRHATKHIQVGSERLSVMNQRLEASQQHVQDLHAELRTVKENHQLVKHLPCIR